MNRWQAVPRHHPSLPDDCEICNHIDPNVPPWPKRAPTVYDSPPRSPSEWALLIVSGVVLALVLWAGAFALLLALT